MTGPDNDVTAALTRALRHHAADVPPADGLPERVLTIAARRRRHRLNASIAAIVALVVGVPAAVVATVDSDGGAPPTATTVDPTWRWESYRGAQVRVPPNWEHGVPGPDWCAGRSEDEPRRVRAGAVGRPADTLTIKCPTDYPPVEERENWLTFDRRDREGKRHIDHGWVEETRRVNGVYITVFSNDNALRAAIFASAQAITGGADGYGCPTTHPVAVDPGSYRPDPAHGGLPPADIVESISVCRYTLDPDPTPPLLSSRLVTGAAAEQAVTAIRSAPEGQGPDDPTSSENDGAEIVVLRIKTTDGTREVVVRYSGGARNGFDDGTTRHELTTDSARPLLTGATSPSSLSLAVATLLGI